MKASVHGTAHRNEAACFPISADIAAAFNSEEFLCAAQANELSSLAALFCVPPREELGIN